MKSQDVLQVFQTCGGNLFHIRNNVPVPVFLPVFRCGKRIEKTITLMNAKVSSKKILLN